MSKWKSIMAGVLAIWIGAAVSAQPTDLEYATEAPTSDAWARSTTSGGLSRAARHLESGILLRTVQDTLRHQIQGGEVLIIALPGEVDGRSVHQYSLARSPALSALVHRSFMWRTLPDDAGSHDVLIAAVVDSVSTDTLVISVTVD